MAAPDDYPNNPGTLGAIPVGGYGLGTINFDGDADWFRVQLVAGQTYVIGLQGAPTGAGTLANPELLVYDAAGSGITFDNDSGFGVESRLTFTPTTSGTYHLSASSAVGGTGTYRLSLDRLPVSPSDFSNDRTSDLLLQGPAPGGGLYLNAWFMQGGAYAGGTQAIPGALVSGVTIVGTGDFNYDGLSDVLYQSGTNVGALLQDFNGQNVGTPVITSLPAGAQAVGTGDFNRDGVTDFVWQNGATVANVLVSRTTTVLGTNTLSTTLPAGWQVVGTGDFNGDQISDLVLQNGGTVVDWLMNATGGYAGGNLLASSLPAGWTVRATGDVNADGTSDIVLQGGSTVVDWIMQNGVYAGGNVLTTTLPAGWNVTGTGDYNGDGTEDLSLQGGGMVVDWIMQNGQVVGGNVVGSGLPAGWNVVGKT